MRLKAFLIMFLMLSYVTAPVFDAVACDDCADPVTSQRGIEAFQIPDIANTTQNNEDQPSAADADAGDLCPICANAALGSAIVKNSAPFETEKRGSQPKLLAATDPSYSITKPPQN